MKRFSKIFSGIAAIMLGVGIILIAFGIGNARGDWEAIMGSEQDSGQVEREFDGIKSIELSLPFGLVDVGISEDGRVYFDALNVKEDALKIQQKGNKLEIRMDSGKNSLFKFSMLPFIAIGAGYWDEEFAVQEYRLLLPQNYNGELDITLGSGRIRVCGVEADRMELSVDAGELLVEDCSANNLKADCDIGNCMVEGLFQDIEVKNDIGMVDVNLYTSKEDYNGVIACEIGSLLYHALDSSGEVDWDTKSGIDLKEKWESRSAKGKLKIKCDIGEVDVVFGLSDAFALSQQDAEASIIELEYYDIPLEEDVPIPQISPLPDASAVPGESSSTRIDTGTIVHVQDN
ncbi:MAG: DUF4097 domain-containing protein [Lachnospiraceae bacterium]|nr:DUF4097 domain-containing protein [Lachnospiraceae bacterium]